MEEDSPPPRAIREAQALLGALGYRAGAPDGIWGTRTAQAYRAFLLDTGLPAVDILTPDALRALRARAQQGVPAERARDAALPPDALHRATQAGDIDAVNAAIAAGVDVNARDARGWTALMHAANKGYTLLVPLLLKGNAEVDIRAPDGATALFIATVHGHAEIFARLMQAGADLSIAGPQGRAPVEVARLRGHSRLLAVPEVVVLLEAEAERKEREEAKRRAEADSSAFSTAKSSDTPQAYKDYLSEWCPGGAYCLPARTRLDESVRERIAGKTFSGPLQNSRACLRMAMEGGSHRSAMRCESVAFAYTRIPGRRQDKRTRAAGVRPAVPHLRADVEEGMAMVMTPEAWTVIGTGVVVLIAIATSHRHLRGEMKALRDEFRGETNRIHAEVGGLRERMAKLEGLLEGLREAITGRKVV